MRIAAEPDERLRQQARSRQQTFTSIASTSNGNALEYLTIYSSPPLCARGQWGPAFRRDVREQ
jgi:hypothetical protein